MQQLIDLRFETNAGLLQGGHFAALERPDEIYVSLFGTGNAWPHLVNKLDQVRLQFIRSL
jgi:hypothetical protein